MLRRLSELGLLEHEPYRGVMLTAEGRRVADVVLSVSRTEEGPVLNLFDGSRVPFANADEVVAPLNLDDGTDNDDDGGGDDGDDDTGGDGSDEG